MTARGLMEHPPSQTAGPATIPLGVTKVRDRGSGGYFFTGFP